MSRRQIPEDADLPSPPAIADYALIGDCRSAALVSKAGSIDWLCLPSFSSPSVFAAILDSRIGGTFSIAAREPFKSRRRYVGPTAVVETTFETATGTARLTDAMIIGGSARNLEPLREIVRIVDGVEGSVILDVRFDPRPDYARAAPRLELHGRDWRCTWRDHLFLLRCECPLVGAGGGAAGEIEVKAGDRFCFSFSHEKGDIAVRMPLSDSAARRIGRTKAWWEEWSGGCRCAGPYRAAVRRSAITLKLMTYPMSGAVVAAPTTSLPEWIGGSRNWDYRYCWLRDAALTMRAFNSLGLEREAGAFLRWLLHATALTRPRLQVVYDVFGRTDLDEFELGHLAGHRGSKPVRIGNAANRQVQLDVYGGVIAAAAEYVESGGRLQKDQLRLLCAFGETVCRLWRDPDHGLWEIRGGKRNYTFSKLMCWVALDRLLALDRMLDLGVRRGWLEKERAAIADAIETRGFNRDLSSYVGELDGDRLDASLLLMPCLGYGDPRGPRQHSTFERLEERLGRGELIYRYDPTLDAVGSSEGAFGICSFWAIENLARRGEADEAERRLGRMLEHANDLGLFAEQIDPETGEALGNFPQAYTHIGLINAAFAIERELEGRS